MALRVRIASWNVARLGARLTDQAAALAGRDPDVVALLEAAGLSSRPAPEGDQPYRFAG